MKVFERTPSQSGGKHTNSTETATGAWICCYKCSPNLSCQMSLHGIRYFVNFSSSHILLFCFSRFNFLSLVLPDFAFSVFPSLALICDWLHVFLSGSSPAQMCCTCVCPIISSVLLDLRTVLSSSACQIAPFLRRSHMHTLHGTLCS